MDQNLLDRFFKGECSPEEHRKVLNWYFSGKADGELAEKIAAYWRSEKTSHHDDWGKETVFQQITQQIDHAFPKEKQTIPISGQSGRYGRKRWWYAAAVLLLITFSGWWLFFASQDHMTQSKEFTYITKQTVRGEKRTVTLNDGTLVKLNAESNIRYSAKFNQDSIREVFLEGEAFFDVAKDASHPFIIHTGSVTTTVLGTSFNINAYAPAKKVEVSVVSGNVKVQQQDGLRGQAVYLLPQEQAICSYVNTAITKRKFDYKHVLSWKDGTLYFKDADFSEIVKMLERWYGVEMVVRKQDVDDGFSGSYTDKSLEYVLNGMSFVLKFEYEIKGETVVIK